MPTTALGNTYINIVLFRYAQHMLKFDGDIVAEGDDGLLGFDDERLVQVLPNFYAQFGLDIKLCSHDGLNGSTFCKVTF